MCAGCSISFFGNESLGKEKIHSGINLIYYSSQVRRFRLDGNMGLTGRNVLRDGVIIF